MMQYHIVHIDENMTQLIDFHGLGSTFSDGWMHSKGFLQSIQQTTAEVAKLLWHAFIFLSFGQASNTFQMFSESQQKRQVLGDLRVYRVWPEKQLC